MLDMYSDFTSVSAQAGIHVEVLEMCDLDECVEQASAAEVEEKIAVARRIFDIEDVPAADLAWAAQVAAGLDRLVDRFQLNGLTYYYRGLGIRRRLAQRFGEIAREVGGVLFRPRLGSRDHDPVGPPQGLDRSAAATRHVHHQLPLRRY